MFILMIVLSIVGYVNLSLYSPADRPVELYPTVVRYDPICEEKLTIANKEVIDGLMQISDLQKDLGRLQIKLDETKAKLLIAETVNETLEAELNTKLIWLILLASLVAIRVGWWLMPYVFTIVRTLIEAGWCSCSYIARLPANLCSRVSAHVGAYQDIEMEPLRPEDAGAFVNEAILPNSPLKPVVSYDRCTFKIYVVDSEFPDKLHYNGIGFWCSAGETAVSTLGHFITASHVLPREGEIVLKAANDETKIYKMDASAWTNFDDYDVSYYKVPQKITTTLGLRKARVAKNMIRDCVVVTAYGRKATSMGTIKPMEKSVYVQYEGSTIIGFSGSPYLAGNTVYGVHIGSSKDTGMGIDMAFVSMKLAHLDKYKNESSEDWLYDEIAKATKRDDLDWKRYGLDDVVVNIRGRDFFLDADEFEEMSRLARSSNARAKSQRPEYQPESFVDTETLPKNCLAPTPVLVAGAQSVGNVSSLKNPKLQKLSLLEETTQSEVTVGPQLTHVPSNEVLHSMLESMNEVSKKVDHLTQQYQKLSGRVFGALPKQSGKQTQTPPKKE